MRGNSPGGIAPHRVSGVRRRNAGSSDVAGVVSPRRQWRPTYGTPAPGEDADPVTPRPPGFRCSGPRSDSVAASTATRRVRGTRRPGSPVRRSSRRRSPSDDGEYWRRQSHLVQPGLPSRTDRRLLGADDGRHRAVAAFVGGPTPGTSIATHHRNRLALLDVRDDVPESGDGLGAIVSRSANVPRGRSATRRGRRPTCRSRGSVRPSPCSGCRAPQPRRRPRR